MNVLSTEALHPIQDPYQQYKSQKKKKQSQSMIIYNSIEEELTRLKFKN